MDFTITLGNVELCFTASQPPGKISATAPKISSLGGKGLEKKVELLNFSGTIKLKSIQQPQGTNDSAMHRAASVVAAPAASSMSDRLGPSRQNKGAGLDILRSMKRPDSSPSTSATKKSPFPTMESKKSERKTTVAPVGKPADIEQMTTPLHISCGSLTPKVEEMETILNSNPSVVFIPDKEGKLPIHHVSCNDRALRTTEAKSKLEVFANKLLTAYPESIVEKDSIGHIPFVHSIMQWIDKELSRTDERVVITPKFVPGLHDFFTVFPSDVAITPVAEWSISMLSIAMDKHGGEIFDKIADAVASINFFVKTILLIECRNTRHTLMATTLFKRVIIDRRTPGLWLIPMLTASDCIYADRCITYFQLVSTATVAHFIGRKRIANPSDIENFQNTQMMVFQKIGKSNFFIPSLCQLSGPQKELAGKTKVIRKIIEDAVSDKFVHTLFCIDIQMLLSLMISFRVLSFNNGIMATIPEARQLYEDGNLFRSQQMDLLICLLICLYFYMRKASQSISLISISIKLFVNTLIGTWYIQLTSITITAVTCLLLLFEVYKDMDILLSINMGLLWISLVYLLQRVIKPVYLFCIAAKKILGNLYWFWLLLFISVMMFGDMMHIYTTNSGYCSKGYTDQNSRNLLFQDQSSDSSTGFHGDIVMTTPYIEEENTELVKDISHIFGNYKEDHPYCTSNIILSYGTTFTILIGQFNANFYDWSGYLQLVAFLFGFFIAIFFIIMLVAIIGEAYEKVKEKAEDVFGRARIDFAAEQVMLANSILRSKYSDMKIAQKLIFIYHWLVLASIFLIYCIMFLLNVVIAMITPEDPTDIIYNGIYSNRAWKITIIMIQMIALGINQILLFDNIFTYYAEEGGALMRLRSFIISPILIIFPAVQGLTSAFGKVTDQDDDWTGRMLGFERSTNAIVSESEKRICKIVKATEERILINEEEMMYCISGIAENVSENKKKRGDDDSSGSYSSNGSSHITFTRADLNLPLPC